ncbi:MAG: phosphoribosylformylglycinamidine synthase I [Candidatus Diapherotrites archaeon]|nr:phosphoribosylformylglycinamidine synthase I [Candidatus Diapherotrites archaeon]
MSKTLVLSGYGLNCEQETKQGFELAGGKADIVHINDLINGTIKLADYQILAVPGGFSYGDDTGSGNAMANKLRNHLWTDLVEFVEEKKLAIGICNGFQILVNLGILPGLNNKAGERQVALLHNNTARYTVRWIDLEFQKIKSPWTQNIETISVPIAHGEGRFFAEPEILKSLKAKNLIACKYVQGEICTMQNLESNPNGSMEDIAGITNEQGNVFGLMPHPDRALYFTQLPHWNLLKAQFKLAEKPLPKYGPGLKVFQNAVNYFK